MRANKKIHDRRKWKKLFLSFSSKLIKGSSPKIVGGFFVFYRSFDNHATDFRPVDNTSEASWGLQASRQTNNVWHSACTGPIACIGYYGTQSPNYNWGALRRLHSCWRGVMDGEVFFSHPSIFVGLLKIEIPKSVEACTSKPSSANILHRAIHRLAFAEPESCCSILRQSPEIPCSPADNRSRCHPSGKGSSGGSLRKAAGVATSKRPSSFERTVSPSLPSRSSTTGRKIPSADRPYSAVCSLQAVSSELVGHRASGFRGSTATCIFAP